MSGPSAESQAGLAMPPGPLIVLPFAGLVAPPLISLVGGVGRVAARDCGVGGAAVGLAISSLLGAGSVGMPAARLGNGSGVLNMARQVGTVLGVEGLVAALGARAAEPLTTFRYGTLVIITLFVAGAACLAVLARPVRPTPVAAAPRHDRPREAA